MERKGSRRNRDDITGNNDNRDDNRIIGSDPAWTMCYSSFRGAVLATDVEKEWVKGEGRVGDHLNCDEEIGGTRLKCIHRVHGHLGVRLVYSRFIPQDLF